ncbi:thiopeptide-type bacteriocin biosynthesis protein [Streptacidiphilus rugosus]|uniref:thiopeptide-type bacteriocin biosynthesis protein n=1 Tax=Streptacidiphilus rugosus TaxID=405783 RepID=UPI00055D272F|nr:thiopeptide-type bacteriocin biosynthesis protein [Streptacidiphilus rugosus]
MTPQPPQGAPRYRAAGPALLRVPALSVDSVTALLAACPVGDPAWPATHRALLARRWRSGRTAAAIRQAAPALAQALGAEDALYRPRVALALDRYLNRMGTRPTPFGLLAGVVGARVARGPAPRLDGPLRARVSPDASWSAGAADVEDVGIVAASLLHVTDGHLWLEPQGSGRPRWLRRSAPVELLLGAVAESPMTAGTLQALLAERYPAAEPASARRLVEQLLRLGVLRRTAGVADPAREAGAPKAVLDLCARFNAAPDPAALPELDAAAGLHRRGGRPAGEAASHLRVASVADIAAPTVDPALATLAEEAASVLALIGRGSRYPADLAQAATVFRRHFGTSARVPALEAVHTLTALRALGGEPPAASDLARETLLAGLVAGALAERRTRVELDDALLARLAPGERDPRPPLPGVDICLRAGREPGRADAPWQGVLSGPRAVPTGVGWGRFTDLLDPATRRGLRAVVRAEEAAAPGYAFAELCYRPRAARAADVTGADLWRTRQLAVDLPAVVHPSGALELADVLVGVEAGRFALFSARLGQRLHLTQSHGLSLRLAPPVCRFLLDASANQFRHPAPFDWGRAALGPFLPRLGRGALVLSPARWRLVLPATGEEFAAEVGEWAGVWMAPRHVRLVEGSGHLLLDLDSAVSLAQLRAALRRSGEAGVLLEEALPLPGHDVLTDAGGERYAMEVVLPVLADRTAAPAATPAAAPASGLRRARPPGDGWFALHLALAAGLHDALLTGPLRRLAEELGPEACFFLRYADPADEIRLRVRCGHRTADALLAWAREAARALPVTDIALRTYRPETDRYGGPDAIGHAERLFCADSAAVLGLLTRCSAPPRATSPHATSPQAGLDRTLLTALSLDRLSRLLLPDLDDRRELAARSGTAEAGAGEFRAHRAALTAGRDAPGPVRDRLEDAAGHWNAPAEAYRSCAGLPETAAVLHLHANRMGLNRTQEATALGVWRRLLAVDAHTARTTGALPTKEVASP